MSKIALSGNASGTGTLTIAAPNTNTDRTFNLPDAGGTLALQGGAGVGKVLQVVQGTTNTQVSVTALTYTDTGLSASITPTSASSRILVLVNHALLITGSTGSVYTGVQLLRNSTTIFSPLLDSTGPYEFGPGVGGMYDRLSINFVDSPGTTSAITYKTQGRPYTGGGQAVFQPAANVSNGTSTIILMEIAA
jgi:hypothetical protein